MYNQLTSEQRYYIEVSLQNKMSKKVIAEYLKVHISTVYREIKRNGGKYHYHHKQAQDKCDERKSVTASVAPALRPYTPTSALTASMAAPCGNTAATACGMCAARYRADTRPSRAGR